MKILGIPIDTLTRASLAERLEFFLADPHFHRIATVNPEFLLLAEKDGLFREVLLKADLRIADGFGIVLAGLLSGRHIPRFAGADLMEEILRLAESKNMGVYLAVRKGGLSSYEEVRSAIMRRHPRLGIRGTDLDSETPKSIPAISEPIVFCGFGAPEQEIFLERLRSQPPIRLVMGVGGSFDYLSGSQERAPQWMRAIGLEWLWRLIRQPRRLGRIWRAVIVFPFRAIFATMNK